MIENNDKENLKKQKRLLAIVIFGCVLMVIVFNYIFSSSEERKKVFVESTFDLPSDKVHGDEIWKTKIEGEAKLLMSRIKFIEDSLMREKSKVEEKDKENEALKREVEDLRTAIQNNATKQDIQETNQVSYSYFPRINEDQEELNVEISARELKEVVSTIEIRKVKNVINEIPAGTSVRAVLVSSVDIPCGVYGQSDPQPVKLQILADGKLPKSVLVNLKGGIIIGSAYGDLSNERVYIRTERLTQTRRGGDFVETEITGYITGEDGKYGIRGDVVDKSGKMLGNAAVSGFFSGVNQVLQTRGRDYTNIEYNNPEQVGSNQAQGILMGGGLGGANNAFDRLTDYYIRRADQIRPIIQVTAGRVVDITITHGVEIGDLFIKDRVRGERERSRQKRGSF